MAMSLMEVHVTERLTARQRNVPLCAKAHFGDAKPMSALGH
jgi:hypothetical protein